MSLLYLVTFWWQIWRALRAKLKKKIPKTFWKRNQIKCSKNRMAELKTNETDVQWENGLAANRKRHTSSEIIKTSWEMPRVMEHQQKSSVILQSLWKHGQRPIRPLGQDTACNDNWNLADNWRVADCWAWKTCPGYSDSMAREDNGLEKFAPFSLWRCNNNKHIMYKARSKFTTHATAWQLDLRILSLCVFS